MQSVTRHFTVQVSAAMKMPGGGMLRVGPGQVTDDSKLALSLAHALIGHEAGHLQGAAAEMYVKWLNSKPFDVGNELAPLDSTHTLLTGSQSHTPDKQPAEPKLAMHCRRYQKKCTFCWFICSAERREQVWRRLFHGDCCCCGR